MRIDDGAKFIRNLKIAHQHRGRIRRDRENDGVAGAKRDRLSSEVEHFGTAAGSETITTTGSLPRINFSRGERAIGKSQIYFGATTEFVSIVRSLKDSIVEVRAA